MEESKYSLWYTKWVVDSQNGFWAMVRTKFICLTVDNSTTVMATDDNMSDYNTYNRIAFDESLSADEREKETKKQFNAQIDILNKALGK